MEKNKFKKKKRFCEEKIIFENFFSFYLATPFCYCIAFNYSIDSRKEKKLFLEISASDKKKLSFGQK